MTMRSECIGAIIILLTLTFIIASWPRANHLPSSSHVGEVLEGYYSPNVPKAVRDRMEKRNEKARRKMRKQARKARRDVPASVRARRAEEVESDRRRDREREAGRIAHEAQRDKELRAHAQRRSSGSRLSRR